LITPVAVFVASLVLSYILFKNNCKLAQFVAPVTLAAFLALLVYSMGYS